MLSAIIVLRIQQSPRCQVGLTEYLLPTLGCVFSSNMLKFELVLAGLLKKDYSPLLY